MIVPATLAAGRSPADASRLTRLSCGAFAPSGVDSASGVGNVDGAAGAVVVVTGGAVVVVVGGAVVVTGVVVVVVGGTVVVGGGAVVVVIGGTVVVVVGGAAADFMKRTVTNMTPSDDRPTPTPIRS